MAQGKSKQMVAIAAARAVDGTTYQVNTMQFRAVLDLSSADTARASGDTNLMVRLPPGVVADHVRAVASVSLTTSTLAFGVAGAPAKYGAAKVYGTDPKTAVTWHEPAAMADADIKTAEDIIMTIGGAALPANGLLIVDVFATARG